jgi:hypothetical protein
LIQGHARRRLSSTLFATAALSCGGGGTATPPVAPTPAPAATSATVCAVGQATAGGRVTDPNGPYAHQVVLARSTDGLNVTDSRMVIDHGSVPDAVRLPDGTLRVYYVNGENGAIGVARVDGDRVTVVGSIVVNGISGPTGMVDPDVLLLADGRIRLYYLNNFGPPNATSPRGMCFADSTDGERFTVGGLSIQFTASATVTDPSVTRLTNGTWLMAASNGQSSVLARSNDGATFSGETSIGLGGVPELAALDGNRVRIYVCSQGIVAHVSSDEGRTWTREATVVSSGTLNARIICDPSFVPGASRFVYKIQP